jgi:hypothetical protein
MEALSSKTASPSPFKSPSYPQRVHIGERARWEGTLTNWKDKVAAVKRKLDVILPGPEREPYDKLFFQMRGAVDQIADAVKRLPMEVGSMYEEDLHRLREAEAALERLLLKWDASRL